MTRGTWITAALATTAIVMTAAPANAERAVSVGRGSGNVLIEFDTATPGFTVEHQITGLGAGEMIVTVDVRPSNGLLYGLTLGGGLVRTYTINPDTGAATLVGPVAGVDLDVTLGVGMDFDPVADEIRVTDSITRENARLDPDTGLRADDPVNDADLSAMSIAGLAYDRSTSPAPAATTAYAIDNDSGTLGTIGGVNGTPSANGGVYTPIAPLGAVSDNQVGFDISPWTGVAYAILTKGTSVNLYRIALTPSASPVATLVGETYGSGDWPMDGLALLPGSGPTPPPPPPPTCKGKRATIVGTNGNDTIKGTKKADVIVTLGGNDKVKAGGGNDRVCGEGGKDKLKGGTGNDKLLGGNDKDKLYGQGGRDKLDGGSSRDVCVGGGGFDPVSVGCETSR